MTKASFEPEPPIEYRDVTAWIDAIFSLVVVPTLSVFLIGITLADTADLDYPALYVAGIAVIAVFSIHSGLTHPTYLSIQPKQLVIRLPFQATRHVAWNDIRRVVLYGWLRKGCVIRYGIGPFHSAAFYFQSVSLLPDTQNAQNMDFVLSLIEAAELRPTKRTFWGTTVYE